MQLKFILNNEEKIWDVNPEEKFLNLLRKNGYLGVKYGCGSGNCGTCTIILDGKAVYSCLLLAPQVQGKKVITIEGLEQEELDPLQESFIEVGAMQCGYCASGMILSAKALLLKKNNPSLEEIKTALTGNLCRCTGYVKPLKAILKVIEKGKLNG